ncbi:hypothetical protein Plo01_22030 [Planobispora longispora]|uniref:Uncharacterized protein n=1 Tax=Planobispora longispora TaxID=28887 RepID=A0A8J3RLF8_9ACTN|nr:hypothetical protein GCM10020093_089160 [Planobispora longispora]GIH75774.1 hypothetical protein Plo01_22030 [Planobispora longispora]
METGSSARVSPVNGAMIAWVFPLEVTCRETRSIISGSSVRFAPIVAAMTEGYAGERIHGYWSVAIRAER